MDESWHRPRCIGVRYRVFFLSPMSVRAMFFMPLGYVAITPALAHSAMLYAYRCTVQNDALTVRVKGSGLAAHRVCRVSCTGPKLCYFCEEK